MSEPKFTPGPWKAEKCTCGHECCTKYNINISGANGMFDKDDANLIAAAPEMYTALSDLILGTPIGSQNRDDDGLTAYPRDMEKRIEQAISALKKARGIKNLH